MFRQLRATGSIQRDYQLKGAIHGPEHRICFRPSKHPRLAQPIDTNWTAVAVVPGDPSGRTTPMICVKLSNLAPTRAVKTQRRT